MTACVNCDRALQPAWKYCIYCGTRTAVAATAPRSRPLPSPAAGSGVARRASAPARTPVPTFSTSQTAQTPIIPVAAPAPLAAAPAVPPVSSEWPESLGERPSLRSALAATEVPPPTPPAAPIDAPDGEIVEELPASVVVDEPIAELEAGVAGRSIMDLVEDDAAPDPEGEDEADAEPEPDAIAEPERDAASDPTSDADTIESAPSSRRPRGPRRRPTASGTLVAEAPAEAPVEAEIEDEPEYSDEVTRIDRTGRVNVLAVLALLLGLLACPLAALFGHVALSQLKTSGERGVIPSWIAIVLGYLWLGFFLVLGITYLATNG